MTDLCGLPPLDLKVFWPSLAHPTPPADASLNLMQGYFNAATKILKVKAYGGVISLPLNNLGSVKNLVLPSEFAVTGNGTDTVTGAWVEDVPYNYIFAGPNTLPEEYGRPVFRLLSPYDIPALGINHFDQSARNYDTSDPTASDNDPYSPGSMWLNMTTNIWWIMTDLTGPTATWQIMGRIMSVADSIAWLTTTTNSSTGAVTIAASVSQTAAKVLATDPTTSSTVDLRSLANEHLPIVAIAKGGTNAATALAGFDNLSPLTTEGDLLTHDGTNNVRLAKPAALQSWRRNAANTAWEAYSSTGSTAPDIQAFTTAGSHTWTKPTTGTPRWVEIKVIAGGYGGGSGRRGATSTVRFGGGGGPGGNVTTLILPADALGATEDVLVGAGGAGGAAQTVDSSDGNAGAVGGTSLFGGLTEATAILAAVNIGAGGHPGIVAAPTASTGNTSFARTVQHYGTDGSQSSTTLSQAEGKSPGYGPASGGSGAYITSANALGAAGDGGTSRGAAFRSAATGGGALAGNPGNGANGTAGDTTLANAATPFGDGAGGGKQSLATGAGAAGGTGGAGGGGGGGGSGSVNGQPSGAGGNGGVGYVIVITYF